MSCAAIRQLSSGQLVTISRGLARPAIRRAASLLLQFFRRKNAVGDCGDDLLSDFAT